MFGSKIFFTILFFISFSGAVLSQDQWSQVGNDLLGNSNGDYFGFSVASSASGSTVAVGIPFNDNNNGNNSGLTKVFEYSNGDWIQKGNDILGEGLGDLSGRSVSLSSNGQILAVGAHQNDGNGSLSGHVRIFEFNGNSWVQLGSDIDGEAAEDRFGLSLELNLDGFTIVIGAPLNDGNGFDSGQVRIYTYDGTNWVQMGQDIDGESSLDAFGTSVAISGNGQVIAVGGPENGGGGIQAGHVRVYSYDGSSWIQLGADIEGESPGDKSGVSVSLSSDGTTVAIGSQENDDAGTNSGQVQVFTFLGGNWVQMGSDIEGEFAVDFSGIVDLDSSGLRLAIGAPGNSEVGVVAGHVRIFDYDGVDWNQIGQDIDGVAGDNFGHSVGLNSNGSQAIMGGYSGDVVRVFKLCPVTSSSMTVNACGTYLVPSGDETYDAIGTQNITDTIQNVCGGDSILFIQLTLSVDSISPGLTCPSDTISNADLGSCFTSLSLGQPVFTDNCGSVTITNNAPLTFSVGVTNVLWSATDNSGNVSYCTQTVTINDLELPTLNCPGSVTVNTDSGTCGFFSSIGFALATDNCGTPVVINDYQSMLPVGSNLITWSAIDSAGNITTCDQTVDVVDQEAPLFDYCPNDTVMNANYFGCSGKLIWADPVIIDNCSGGTISSNYSPGDIFGLGLTTVNYTATDSSGNYATCSFDVTVISNLHTNSDSIKDVSCFGDSSGSIHISTYGGNPPYIFDWNNDGSGDFDDFDDQLNLSEGNYSLTVVDSNDCSYDTTFHISEPPELTLSSIVSHSSNSSDGSIDLIISGGVPPYLIDWDNDGIGDNDDYQDLDSLSAGDYQVIVFDSNGCCDTLLINILSTLNISDQQAPTYFRIYPNPNRGQFSIDVGGRTGVELSIYNSIGQCLYEFIELKSGVQNYNLDLGPGVYLVQFKMNGRLLSSILCVE